MRVAFSLSFALAVLVHASPGAQAPPFSVVVRGGPAQPGSVLEIRIQAPEGASDPRGTAFERPLVGRPGHVVSRLRHGESIAPPQYVKS